MGASCFKLAFLFDGGPFGAGGEHAAESDGVELGFGEESGAVGAADFAGGGVPGAAADDAHGDAGGLLGGCGVVGEGVEYPFEYVAGHVF